MESQNDKKVLNWVILLALALVWGSSFILMKRGLDVFSSSQVAAIRIFFAFLFLSPLLFRHIKKDLLVHWKAFLGMGLCGNLIPAFLFTKAETGISSSLAGMLNSLTPLFTVITGVLFFGSKTRWQNIVGVLIGLVGAIGLMASKSNAVPGQLSAPLYSLYVVAATVLYALSVNIIGKYLKGVSPITAAVWALFFIGPMAGIYLFSTDFISVMQVHPGAWKSLGYVSLLGIFGTALSVIIFNLLIRNSNPVFASSVTYLIPVVALMWGVFDGESVEFMHFVWIAVILGGVYLVNSKIKPSAALQEESALKSSPDVLGE
jgi:drug/metabolite transporter (DMT)-like permease